jgi:hypothetical protein
MARLSMEWDLSTRCRDEILHRSGPGLCSSSITDLITDQSFTVVRLSTGRLGLSMNYGVISEGRAKMRSEAERLREQLGDDPLLLRTLWDTEWPMNPLLRGSLMISLLSALSRSLLRSTEPAGFIRHDGGLPLHTLTRPGDSVTVIGLGGYLRAAMADPNVRRVFLADLYIKKDSASSQIDALRTQHPDKELSASDGSENEAILRRSQVACITASSLSNGTAKELLAAASGCRSVILQGKSGNLFPLPLFDHGATHVTTHDVKPEHWEVIRSFCATDPSGDFSEFIDANLRDQVTYSRRERRVQIARSEESPPW